MQTTTEQAAIEKKMQELKKYMEKHEPFGDKIDRKYTRLDGLSEESFTPGRAARKAGYGLAGFLCAITLVGYSVGFSGTKTNDYLAAEFLYLTCEQFMRCQKFIHNEAENATTQHTPSASQTATPKLDYSIFTTNIEAKKWRIYIKESAASNPENKMQAAKTERNRAFNSALDAYVNDISVGEPTTLRPIATSLLQCLINEYPELYHSCAPHTKTMVQTDKYLVEPAIELQASVTHNPGNTAEINAARTPETKETKTQQLRPG